MNIGVKDDSEIALHFALLSHRKHGKHGNDLPCKMCVTQNLQKLRNVKTKNNLE